MSLVALRSRGVGLMRFRILGPVEAWAGERRLVLGGPRQATLLAFLVLNANRAISTDSVIDALWGPERSGARKRLQMAISRLRKVLEPLETDGKGVLRTVSGGYVLSIGSGELDSDVFAERIQDGRRALERRDHVGASELLHQALELWRGTPLAEVAFEDFAQPEIRRLEELRLTALETRIDADLELGRHAELVVELEVLVGELPGRERLAGQLMTALYRSGRQSHALEVYQRTRKHLSQELGLEPGPALRLLQSQILAHAPALKADSFRDRVAGESRSDNQVDRQGTGVSTPEGRAVIPVPPTPTIGREREVEMVRDLLIARQSRLVTLTGPGGVGKTRLAVMAARAVESAFRDGACWVELGAIAGAGEVASTIVRALALTPQGGETAPEALRRFLANKQLLLVIDNFEHVTPAAGLVAQLHATCSGAAILTTSRQPLDLAAEQRVSVEPLVLPDVADDTVTVAEIEAAAASALFLAAVRRRDHRFRVAPVDAPAVSRICRRLDGLPLALELAAARTELLSLQELAERVERATIDLDEGPRDAPARQRTLVATIEWSLQQLDADQQRMFVGLGVFAGGATLEAAHAVTGATLKTLQQLVTKNLITRSAEPERPTRLIMLQTLRDFALARLAEDPRREALHRHHYQYYGQLLERTVEDLETHQERAALRVLDSEVGNLIAAVRWVLGAAPVCALRSINSLARYWKVRGDSDGLSWLDAALQAAGQDAPPQDRARAQYERAYQLYTQRRREEGDRAAAEALSLFRQTHDDAGVSEVSSTLAIRAWRLGNVKAAREYAYAARRHAQLARDDRLIGKATARLAVVSDASQRRAMIEQAAAYLTRVGDHGELTRAYSNTAYVALKEGDVAEAARLLDLAVPTSQAMEAPATEMFLFGNLGLARLFSGEYEEARAAFEQQLRICLSHGFRHGADEGLVGLAAVSAHAGELESAARLLGAARELGYPTTGDQPILDRLDHDYFQPARASYGNDAWSAAESAGAELTYEHALGCALGGSA